VGERSIGQAIELENQAAAQRHELHHDLFSRGVQQFGGALGALLYGLFLGVVFAVVFAAVRHRLAGPDDARRSARLAAAGFVALFLVPFCKYPANPPAVGDPATITRRTVLYLVVLAWSVVALWGAWRLARWLAAASSSAAEPARAGAALAAYCALVAVAYVGLPGPPDPVTAPATLVWRFRLATVGGAALLWAVLGLTFGALALRSPRPR